MEDHARKVVGLQSFSKSYIHQHAPVEPVLSRLQRENMTTWVARATTVVLLSWRFPSCISPLFQSEAQCEAFDMEISFIHMQILVNLHVNKTDFHMKGFVLGLTRGERQLGNRQVIGICLLSQSEPEKHNQ